MAGQGNVGQSVQASFMKTSGKIPSERRIARTNRRWGNRACSLRAGIAMLETIVVLPVLLFLALGMMEFGQFIYIDHIIQSACRDATRAAIPATAQSGDPTAAATRTLAQANIPFSSVTMLIQDTATGWSTVTDVSTVPAGHNLEVTLTATYSQLPNVYRPFNNMTGHGISNSKTIQSISMMTKE